MSASPATFFTKHRLHPRICFDFNQQLILFIRESEEIGINLKGHNSLGLSEPNGGPKKVSGTMEHLFNT